MTIKQQIIDDIELFFDTDEFAEEVTIYGKDGNSLATDVVCNFIDGSELVKGTRKAAHNAKFYIPNSAHPNGKFSIGEKIEREEEPGVLWRIYEVPIVEKGVSSINVRTDSRGY